MTRATDANADAEVTSGMFTFVEEGTVNADSGFVLTTDGSITVGSTSLSFVQFSGAGQITAGEGMSKTGNTLDVNDDNITLEINNDNVRIKGISATAVGGLTYRCSIKWRLQPTCKTLFKRCSSYNGHSRHGFLDYNTRRRNILIINPSRIYA